jgi:hypothetical protein
LLFHYPVAVASLQIYARQRDVLKLGTSVLGYNCILYPFFVLIQALSATGDTWQRIIDIEFTQPRVSKIAHGRILESFYRDYVIKLLPPAAVAAASFDLTKPIKNMRAPFGIIQISIIVRIFGSCRCGYVRQVYQVLGPASDRSLASESVIARLRG